MKKILIITPTLSSSGGRERVMSNFSKYLVSRLDITFLTLNGSTETYYPIPKEIQIKTINTFFQESEKAGASKMGYLKDIIKLRRVLKKYKGYTIISTDVYITIFLYFATIGRKYFVIANEHLPFNISYSSKFWEKARNFTYPKVADIVVTLTERDKRRFEQIGCKTCVTIPNALTFQHTETAPLTGKSLLAIGRFTAQKGFDILIDVCATVFEKHKDWKLDIFGEGPKKNELEEQIKGHGLTGRIMIHPATTEIKKVYQNADIYVLSSRYEAFPMVLIESMSFGLPVIAFDCETGPAEIITPEEDGILVPAENAEMLKIELCRLMEHESLRRKLGAAAYLSVRRLTPEKIFGRWETLISTNR